MDRKILMHGGRGAGKRHLMQKLEIQHIKENPTATIIRHSRDETIIEEYVGSNSQDVRQVEKK